MPIFEYRCEKCNRRFELLVNSETKVVCPDCRGEKVVKLFSAFASYAKRGSADNPGCYAGVSGCDLGKCGSGFCGLE